METIEAPTETQKVEPPQPRVAIVSRHTGGRHGRIRAEAKRRRFRANAIVVSTTVAVLAMVAVFDLLLSR